MKFKIRVGGGPCCLCRRSHWQLPRLHSSGPDVERHDKSGGEVVFPKRRQWIHDTNCYICPFSS